MSYDYLSLLRVIVHACAVSALSVTSQNQLALNETMRNKARRHKKFPVSSFLTLSTVIVDSMERV